MELYTEITKALVEIIKEGGVIGIWGLAIYLVVQLIRLITICIVVFNLGKLLMSTVMNIITVRCLGNKDRVAVISENCSDSLRETVETFSKDMTQSVKEFMEQAKDLLEKQKNSPKE